MEVSGNLVRKLYKNITALMIYTYYELMNINTLLMNTCIVLPFVSIPLGNSFPHFCSLRPSSHYLCLLPPPERLVFVRYYLHLGLSLWCDVGEHVVVQPLHHLHHLLGVGRTGVDHLVDHFPVAVAVCCRHVDEGLWGGGRRGVRRGDQRCSGLGQGS